MYIVKLYNEFRLWRKFYKATKNAEDFLNENDMRVDMLGRIYTVLNMPYEVATHTKEVQEAWAMKQLNPFNEVLLKVGLAGHVYPEFRKLKDPGSSAYLVYLYPLYEALAPWKILVHIIKYVFIYFVLKFAFNIALTYIDFNLIYDWIKQFI